MATTTERSAVPSWIVLNPENDNGSPSPVSPRKVLRRHRDYHSSTRAVIRAELHEKDQILRALSSESSMGHLSNSHPKSTAANNSKRRITQGSKNKNQFVSSSTNEKDQIRRVVSSESLIENLSKSHPETAASKQSRLPSKSKQRIKQETKSKNQSFSSSTSSDNRSPPSPPSPPSTPARSSSVGLQEFLSDLEKDRLEKFGLLQVEGASENVNGTYRCTGTHDDVGLYSKSGLFYNRKVTFTIFRCVHADGTRRWYLSIASKRLGTKDDYDLYAALGSDTGRVPPTQGWRIVVGSQLKGRPPIVLWTRNEGKCKKCLERPVSHVALPCGHAVFCLLCAMEQGNCPQCQSHVDRVIRLGLYDMNENGGLRRKALADDGNFKLNHRDSRTNRSSDSAARVKNTNVSTTPNTSRTFESRSRKKGSDQVSRRNSSAETSNHDIREARSDSSQSRNRERANAHYTTGSSEDEKHWNSPNTAEISFSTSSSSPTRTGSLYHKSSMSSQRSRSVYSARLDSPERVRDARSRLSSRVAARSDESSSIYDSSRSFDSQRSNHIHSNSLRSHSVKRVDSFEVTRKEDSDRSSRSFDLQRSRSAFDYSRRSGSTTRRHSRSGESRSDDSSYRNTSGRVPTKESKRSARNNKKSTHLDTDDFHSGPKLLPTTREGYRRAIM